MNQCDAQGHKAQGVSFSVVVVHHVLGLAEVLQKPDQDDDAVDRGKKIPQHNRPGGHGKGHDARRAEKARGQEYYAEGLLRPVEILEVYKEKQCRPVLVHEQKTRGKTEKQDGQQIDSCVLYHLLR